MVTFYIFTVGPRKEPYGSRGLDGTPLSSRLSVSKRAMKDQKCQLCLAQLRSLLHLLQHCL